MKCENCGHSLVEAESYDGEGDVRMILVHSTQSMTSLPCEDVCICGCEKAKIGAGK
jgi:hypothetical protein